LVKTHIVNPLHRIQVRFSILRGPSTTDSWFFEEWSGDRFSRTSLKQQGLIIQLNHAIGSICANPVKTPWNDFVILDTHGVHEVNLRYCGCEKAIGGGHTSQLLRRRLLPATSDNPKTAATFRVMELYHLLSFEAKVSMFGFYYTLARASDNTTGTLMQKPERDYTATSKPLELVSRIICL
jgi:hypothetical protein